MDVNKVMEDAEQYDVAIHSAKRAAHNIVMAAVVAADRLGMVVTVDRKYNFETKEMDMVIETRFSRGTYTKLEELKKQESQT